MEKEFNNINFNPKTIEVINLYKPLADWFTKLHFSITRFELHKPHYESYFNEYAVSDDMSYYGANMDILVLEKMVNVAMCWLEDDNYIGIERAFNAALAISIIYEKFKDSLSESAVQLYKIDVNNLLNKNNCDVLNPPKMTDLEIQYLESKKHMLSEELLQIETSLQTLKNKKNIKN